MLVLQFDVIFLEVDIISLFSKLCFNRRTCGIDEPFVTGCFHEQKIKTHTFLDVMVKIGLLHRFSRYYIALSFPSKQSIIGGTFVDASILLQHFS